MAKVRQIQASFVSGELDPRLLGRIDTDIYTKGASQLRNVYVRPQGGVFRREGLEYVATTTSSQAGRLVPFEFNDEQTYILVFTPGEFKVYRTDLSAVQATVSSSPISGLTATEIAEMRWTQSADTLYLVHPDQQPIKITRTSHTSWTAATVSFSNISTFDFGAGAEAVISATRGWPRSVAFFKGRLWLGGLKSRPQTILASKVGSFEDLNVGTGLDDEGLDVTIDDDRVNIIRDLFPGRGLQIFTSGGEFTIRSDINDAVTPSNVADQLRKETLHGSGPASGAASGTSWPRPTSVDGATVFTENSGGVMRQFVFNETEQSFNANNISILSQSIIGTPVAMDIRRSVTNHPSDFLYVVNSDGKCAVLNSLREQDLLAWSLFETTGTFEDVAVSGREVYFIVNRTINGATVRYLEKLNSDHYMDASTLQNAAPASSNWSNLDHLEAETVKVRGDDFILDDELVVSGTITSSEEVSQLEAGINFSAKVEILPVEIAIQGQSFAGQFKSMVFLNIRFFESRNAIVTYDGRTHEPSFREFGDDVLDDPVSNFTGWKKVYVGGFNRDAQGIITQTEPLEFNVLSLVYGVRV